jgi:hypothetical protein
LNDHPNHTFSLTQRQCRDWQLDAPESFEPFNAPAIDETKKYSRNKLATFLGNVALLCVAMKLRIAAHGLGTLPRSTDKLDGSR